MAKRGEQTDYIAHGSNEHAALLGLVKATKDDELQYKGWTLADFTMYGVAVTELFLKQTLTQKVNELLTKPPKTQSTDPIKPHYAPKMWVPPDGAATGRV